MDLVLDREYWPGGTNDALMNEWKTLVHTTELPTAYFRQALCCLPEGTYEVELLKVLRTQK
jgi:hypothetical protein